MSAQPTAVCGAVFTSHRWTGRGAAAYIHRHSVPAARASCPVGPRHSAPTGTTSIRTRESKAHLSEAWRVKIGVESCRAHRMPQSRVELLAPLVARARAASRYALAARRLRRVCAAEVHRASISCPRAAQHRQHHVGGDDKTGLHTSWKTAWRVKDERYVCVDERGRDAVGPTVAPRRARAGLPCAHTILKVKDVDDYPHWSGGAARIVASGGARGKSLVDGADNRARVGGACG